MIEEKITSAPAVVIAPEHQSSPKDHWSKKEMLTALEEVRTGQATVDLSDGEFFDAGPTQYLAQLPRVQDVLRRLESEKREAKNPQEMLEATAQMHEMNRMAAQANMWDGQGRWIGKENEEMRMGRILQPLEFMKQLWKVVSDQRVQINRWGVKEFPSAKSARVALLAPNAERQLILMPGMPEPKNDELVQVATLQWPYSTEWMIMRFDEYGCPTTAKYLGWRTTLLCLITCGVITEKEAHKAFPLSSGPAADWYREQLFAMRNNGKIMVN